MINRSIDHSNSFRVLAHLARIAVFIPFVWSVNSTPAISQAGHQRCLDQCRPGYVKCLASDESDSACLQSFRYCIGVCTDGDQRSCQEDCAVGRLFCNRSGHSSSYCDTNFRRCLATCPTEDNGSEPTNGCQAKNDSGSVCIVYCRENEKAYCRDSSGSTSPTCYCQ